MLVRGLYQVQIKTFCLSAQLTSGAFGGDFSSAFWQQTEEILQMSPIMGMSGVNKNRTVLFSSVIDPCLWFFFLDYMEMPCMNFQRDYIKTKLAFPKGRLATQRYWLKKQFSESYASGLSTGLKILIGVCSLIHESVSVFWQAGRNSSRRNGESHYSGFVIFEHQIRNTGSNGDVDVFASVGMIFIHL